jgi:hypothetical protein
MIYEYVIDPFRNPWQNNGIKVQIGIVYNRRCHPFRNGYEMRIPVAVKPPRIRYYKPDEDSDDDSSEGSESDDGFNDQSNNHINFHIPEAPHYHLKRQDYDTIWALSQVNHQIRAELGTLFWHNVFVDVDHFPHLLLDFLKDHPAAATGIKKLRMSWDCDSDETDLDYTIFGDFCAHIAQHLVLDELVFVLCTSPLIARQILATEGEGLEWVRDVRAINVRKLKVNLFLVDNEHDVFDDDDPFHPDFEELEEEDGRYSRLTREMGPKMEALLRPEAPVVEVTEQDGYLMSRGA